LIEYYFVKVERNEGFHTESREVWQSKGVISVSFDTGCIWVTVKHEWYLWSQQLWLIFRL